MFQLFESCHSLQGNFVYSTSLKDWPGCLPELGSTNVGLHYTEL